MFYMILWELNSDKEFHVDEMNNVFKEFGIPPIATEDSDVRVFRRAWVQFSSIKDKELIANFINNNKIAIVRRNLSPNDALHLRHIGSIELEKHQQAGVSLSYQCFPDSCNHKKLIRDIKGKTCELCGRDIPDIVYTIIERFNNELGLVSNSMRSKIYIDYVTGFLKGFSFLSSGRPYTIPEKSYADAKSFVEAINKIGDKGFLLSVNDGDDAQRLLLGNIQKAIQEVELELDGMKRRDGLENRLEAVIDLLQRVDMFATILDVTKEELVSKGQELKKKIEVALM